jgi:hypothetical protein
MLKRLKRILIALGVIGILVVGFGYGFQVWWLRSYGATSMRTSDDILHVDRSFSFPPGFPPDPGDAGKETIEGIDSDHDGVRDDVQRWIYAYLPNDRKKQMALRQVARYFQDSLRDDYDRLEVRNKNQVLLERALDCRFSLFTDELHGYVETEYLKAKVLNTFARTSRYWDNQNMVTSKEMTGLPLRHYEKPCDDR